jgi:TRAP-type mannitol/chloroaromatic compound transport system permease large subunit
VTSLLIDSMAPLMFLALVVFLLFGYPVAFALAANGLMFGLIGIELGLLSPELLQALPERIFGIMKNDTLLARCWPRRQAWSRPPSSPWA